MASNSRSSLCGNCKHFVAGGLCELVRGQIKAKDTCDLHAYGNPQPIDTEVEPKYNKLEVNYKPGFMVETTVSTGDIAQKAIQMEHELLSRGIPQEEVHRAVIAYFSQREPPYAEPWPGPVTGLDLAGRVNNVIVPDTGQPTTYFQGLPKDVQPYPTSNVSPYGIGSSLQPYQSFFTPDPNSVGSLSNVYDVLNPPYPYKSESESANWLGLASDPNSEPSMHGEYGFNVAKAIPEWRYPIEQSQMYPLKIPDIIIPPSGAILQEALLQLPFFRLDLPRRIISKKVLQESIANLRSEFDWLTDDYISKARELAHESGGQLYLIRAAGETITDHTGEGEPYRRKLSAEELNSMTRTAIGKSMDINHQPEYETDATILDADFDTKRKEIQMLVIERDPQINNAIADGKIAAVSINGGPPRSESVEPCDHDCNSGDCELCLVPKGVVLGETDGIALTYVVTDPQGLYWNGHFVPSAEAGIKFTKIQIL